MDLKEYSQLRNTESPFKVYIGSRGVEKQQAKEKEEKRWIPLKSPLEREGCSVSLTHMSDTALGSKDEANSKFPASVELKF